MWVDAYIADKWNFKWVCVDWEGNHFKLNSIRDEIGDKENESRNRCSTHDRTLKGLLFENNLNGWIQSDKLSHVVEVLNSNKDWITINNWDNQSFWTRKKKNWIQKKRAHAYEFGLAQGN